MWFEWKPLENRITSLVPVASYQKYGLLFNQVTVLCILDRFLLLSDKLISGSKQNSGALPFLLWCHFWGRWWSAEKWKPLWKELVILRHRAPLSLTLVPTGNMAVTACWSNIFLLCYPVKHPQVWWRFWQFRLYEKGPLGPLLPSEATWEELENYFRVGASMGSKLRYQFSVSPTSQFADPTWGRGRRKSFSPIFPKIKQNFLSPKLRFK